MKNLEKRKAFNFYRSYYDVFKMLPLENKLEFITAILEKQFENKEPNLEGIVSFAYQSQKHNIDSQVDGFLNKIKSFDPPSEGGSYTPTEPPKVQEKEKEKEEVKEKEQEQGETLDRWNLIFSFFPRGKQNGSDEAKTIWNGLPSEVQQNIIKHLKIYVKSTEERYLKQIGNYFNDKMWEQPIKNYSNSKPKIKSLDFKFIEWYRISNNIKRFDDARTKLAVLQYNLPDDFIEIEEEYKSLITKS